MCSGFSAFAGKEAKPSSSPQAVRCEVTLHEARKAKARQAEDSK